MILSAGTYQSPVLLMLAGIGPAADLAIFGIPVRQDLPVGENLQDHCMVNVNYLADEQAAAGIFTPENSELLHSEGRGPLTSNYPEAGGFFKTRSDLQAPDVEFHFAAAPFLRRGAHASARQRLRVRARDHQAHVARRRNRRPADADARLEADGALQLP